MWLSLNYISLEKRPLSFYYTLFEMREDSWNLYLHVIHQQYKILLSPLTTGNRKSSRYCFILGEELSMHTAFGGIAKSKCSVCICIMSLFIAFLRILIIPFLFDNILLAINVDTLHTRIRENTKHIVLLMAIAFWEFCLFPFLYVKAVICYIWKCIMYT